MKLCAIETKELEEKILTRFAENQNDELLEDLSDYVINSQKEIEKLNKELEDLKSITNIEMSKSEYLEKENKRLNNILNELEKESYLGMIENQNNNDYAKGLYTAYKYINDKLQELKGEKE